MRKNILYTSLIIILLILIFGVAATCNFCGNSLSIEDENSTEVSSDKVDIETNEPNEIHDNSTSEVVEDPNEDTDTDHDAGEQNHSPVILHIAVNEVEIDLSEELRVLTGENANFLVIAEDQDSDELTYAASDNNGNDMDTVKIDNNTAGFGWVAPSDPGQYEIYITVSDDIGEDTRETVHINVNDSEDIEDAGISTILNVDRYNSGYLDSDGSGEFRGDIIIGDNDENKAIRGFISFDIRSLPDSPINNAELRLSDITKTGDPTTLDSRLLIYNTYYGSLDSSDYELGSSFTLTLAVPTEGLTYINNSSGVLRSHLEARRSNGADAFQIMLIFDRDSNNNDSGDWFTINPDNVELEISQ